MSGKGVDPYHGCFGHEQRVRIDGTNAAHHARHERVCERKCKLLELSQFALEVVEEKRAITKQKVRRHTPRQRGKTAHSKEKNTYTSRHCSQSFYLAQHDAAYTLHTCPSCMHTHTHTHTYTLHTCPSWQYSYGCPFYAWPHLVKAVELIIVVLSQQPRYRTEGFLEGTSNFIADRERCALLKGNDRKG